MNGMTKTIFRLWYDEDQPSFMHPLPLLLHFLSFPYQLISASRNVMYNSGIFKQNKLPCPVISVGNLTVGGTGKTPTVIMLSNMLKAKGYKPAILSRGYGGSATAPVSVVSDGVSILMDHQQAGDEAVMMAQETEGIPILIGPRRYRTGLHAINHFQANILVLDDAFQHRSLFRDINIVLLDAVKPFGNGYLLPRGPLRESTQSLQRADMILRTGVLPGHEENVTDITSLLSDIPSLHSCHTPKYIHRKDTEEKLPVAYLQDKKLCAFCGIGSPVSFKNTLESLGGSVVSFLPFPDHHRYTKQDMELIINTATEESAELIITTSKDGIKLADDPNFLQQIFILGIEMKIIPSPVPFEKWISGKLGN